MIGQKADKKLYIACEAVIGKTAARELNQSPDQDACNMARTAIQFRENILTCNRALMVNLQISAQEKSVHQL